MTPTEALAALRLEQRIRRARVDLVTWCELAGPPLYDWQKDAAAYLQSVSEQLVEAERAFLAKEPIVQIRLQVEVMTQVGKTHLVSLWMAWHVASKNQNAAVASYAASLAEGISDDVRAALRSGLALRVWPHLGRKKNESDDVDDTGQRVKDSSADWSVTNADPKGRNVRFAARGREGGLNGHAFWLVVGDDLLKNQTEYASKAMRDQAWSFVQSQAYLRVQTRGGAIVLVGSRWGSDDPHGRQRKESAGSRRAPVVLSYPLKAKPGDRMGRKPGQYLLPGFTPEGEADTRVELGARLAAAVLDCEPIDDAGSTFKPTFFSRTYAGSPADVARICDWHVLALDGAETAGAGDWSVLTWVGRREGRYYKLGQWRQQVEFPELLMLTRNVIAEVKPHATLVEKKSAGKQVYQVIERELPNVIGVDKGRGKRVCYLAASPVFEAGGWLMPEQAQPWQNEYVERMGAVTGLKAGEVDDEADADVMVILWDQERQGTSEVDPAEVLRLLRGGARR
jgi:predicted phage terminase large subunit-like protein